MKCYREELANRTGKGDSHAMGSQSFNPVPTTCEVASCMSDARQAAKKCDPPGIGI